MLASFQRLFSAGYRIFFFLAGLFATLLMLIWEGWLAGQSTGGPLIAEPFAMAPQHWHAHEMIFGYGSAAIAGFLLTAAPNWTGTRAAPARFFVLMSTLWLAGRVAIWCSGSIPALLVATLDLAFVPLLAARILVMVLQRPKPPQMILVGVILLVWYGNLLVHLEWTGLTDDTAWAGLRVGLLSMAALIVILGGRVTPAFTRNAMLRHGHDKRLPRNSMRLAAMSIAPAIAVPLALAFGLPDLWVATLAILAGTGALLRLSLWRGFWTWKQPILWSLHLSYGANAIGLIAFGLGTAGHGSEIGALHLLGIAGVGGMTLAVMSRAALGHSGRPLVAPPMMALAYILLPLAALARYTGTASADLYLPAALVAGGLWILAFALYTTSLWPIFWGERQTPPQGDAP